jgi:hypothetical protein
MNERETEREENFKLKKKEGLPATPTTRKIHVMTVMEYWSAKDSAASVSHPKEPESSQHPPDSGPHAHRLPYPDGSSPFARDTARAAVSCV